MNGKTLGSSSLRDINAAATLAWIDKNGGDSTTVRVVEVPASAGQAFLEQHRADAVTLNEPAVTQTLAGGTGHILARPYRAVGSRITTAGFAAMEPGDRPPPRSRRRSTRARCTRRRAIQAHLFRDGRDGRALQRRNARRRRQKRALRSMRSTPRAGCDATPDRLVCAKYGLIDHTFPAVEVISKVAVRR